ncbi:glycosyltransferase family 4 protein [Roseateles oligotrophus]|uniref:Glycosyltransferase n=1 Tax=Roseateles oligotrophus TaxID=1769250 RepID=A0ABT2YE04_9BURK|nr:glycosyltransferase [Roseateles oligotrophus]MCV2368251.1 glycosyltransferase [Roseateles oligotrophus]
MPQSVKPIVLVFAAFYVPGYRGGGPIRSIENMVARLSDEFEFLIVSSDRDLDDKRSYENVNVDSWNEIGPSKVFYASPSVGSFLNLIRLLREIKYDILYLNSFFGVKFSILPLFILWLRLAARKPVVLAPRGEFSSGALKLKSWKKSVYIKLARHFGIYRDVIWHASTDFESVDIKRTFEVEAGSIVQASNMLVAADLLSSGLLNGGISSACGGRGAGCLSVCFLSRLSPKKNLGFALNILAHVSVPMRFTIYGPLEDPDYWRLCKNLIDELPKHITVTYAGSVPHEQVVTTLAKHDVFFLPTLGENFGHVFLEAWAAGVPVLVSDQTPWRDLERRKLGWDISLDVPADFVQALEEAALFDDVKWAHLRQECQKFANSQTQDVDALAANRALFRR